MIERSRLTARAARAKDRTRDVSTAASAHAQVVSSIARHVPSTQSTTGSSSDEPAATPPVLPHLAGLPVHLE
jgi:hypothetical protein